MPTATHRERPNADFAGRLAALPTRPGVYLMKDKDAVVLYVGKAASLRSRVRSYFGTPAGKDQRIQIMVARIADFEYIVTESVQEALLLENLLIKQHQPFFNARLKDDKTYPYIKIDLREEFPQVYFTRRVLADGARYFGPFASAGSVRKTMDLLKKLFPYRSCTKVITGTDERPCLEYYIHRCVAPCIGAVDREEYGGVIQQVLHFLEGDSERVTKGLAEDMATASDELKFERAAVLRDQLRAIESVSQSQRVVSPRGEDTDVIALAHDQGEVWVEVFKVRRGKLIGRDHFLMDGGDAHDEPGLMEQFVQQFYDAVPDVPPTLLLQHPIENAAVIEEWLSAKRGKAVSVVHPQRGNKRRLVEMAAQNALEGLNQRRLKWLSESDKVLQALTEIQEALSLPDLPSRIECYDVSNIQGTSSVGSMVVFEDGRPKPSHYRRFQIRDVDGIDDYASMQEMLRRRFRRLGETLAETALEEAQESGDSPSPLDGERAGGRGEPPSSSAAADDAPANRQRPRRYARTGVMAPEEAATGARQKAQESFGLVPGLVVIDGGRGHLNAVQQVFLELGVTGIPLCSIAKQEEEIFLPHMAEPVVLPRGSQGLYLVQRVRDEAHRFAITYHRQRRSKAATRSVLDEVPGIGPKRRRELLRRFGSVAGIRAASLEELASVPGMSAASARKLAEHLGGA
ncbi:MAG: excinuclease ABC subunit UvrC [Chloroflexi bacterium]|nr:excinuclease ABC subunit UvrC [Chloroflexota bacterium]